MQITISYARTGYGIDARQHKEQSNYMQSQFTIIHMLLNKLLETNGVVNKQKMCVRAGICRPNIHTYLKNTTKSTAMKSNRLDLIQ